MIRCLPESDNASANDTALKMAAEAMSNVYPSYASRPFCGLFPDSSSVATTLRSIRSFFTFTFTSYRPASDQHLKLTPSGRREQCGRGNRCPANGLDVHLQDAFRCAAAERR